MNIGFLGTTPQEVLFLQFFIKITWVQYIRPHFHCWYSDFHPVCHSNLLNIHHRQRNLAFTRKTAKLKIILSQKSARRPFSTINLKNFLMDSYFMRFCVVCVKVFSKKSQFFGYWPDYSTDAIQKLWKRRWDIFQYTPKNISCQSSWWWRYHVIFERCVFWAVFGCENGVFLTCCVQRRMLQLLDEFGKFELGELLTICQFTQIIAYFSGIQCISRENITRIEKLTDFWVHTDRVNFWDFSWDTWYNVIKLSHVITPISVLILST